jgi:hypothetical protein
MSNTLDFEKICSAEQKNLRKAEILLYSKGKKIVSKVDKFNLPNSNITIIHNTSYDVPVDPTNPKNKLTKKIYRNFKLGEQEVILSDKIESITLQINNLSQTFYPLLITFWGKIYDDCEPTNKFKMVSSLRNNTSNITTFILNNDNTMTMQIENISLDSSTGFNTGCSKDSSVDKLIAKIIIIYDPCQ